MNDPSIDPYNSILFVCHWYWGADLFNFSAEYTTDWRVPYLASGPSGFCDELVPADIAGCNDTERIECNAGLCDGCPHDNFHQCSTEVLFNGQMFGNEGCQFIPIQPTCSDGVTPTFSPTASPTFTEPNLNVILQTANSLRADAVKS